MTATQNEPAPLTKRQRQMLDEVTRFHAQHGYCTSVRELMRKFGWASPNAVVCHLTALRKLGLVTWEPGIARTIRPTGGDQ